MKIKLLGIIVAFLGIIAACAHLMGYFADEEKLSFADLVMNSKTTIARNTPVFEKFLAAFPPPEDVDPSSVTHIADKELKWDSESNVGSSVAYIADGKRTLQVARFDQVKDWASSTFYGWLSLGIIVIVWVIEVIVMISENMHDRKHQNAKLVR